MKELRFATIADALAALDRREVSAVELTRLHLDAIAAENPHRNAFLRVTEEDALAGAAAADRARAAGEQRPLLGIPVSLKDLIDQAGVVTTAGTRAPERMPAAEDAEVVRRLRAAGAVILGKTTLHELGFGPTSENPHSGPVPNPADPSRIAGGSSGGSAAAVAAGLSFASIGTDSGGSIRVPAALCGVAGHKPTFGLVPRRGVQPLSWSLDHVGPLARTAADCAAVLAAIAGHDPADPSSNPAARFAYPNVLPKHLRLGVVRDASAWLEPAVRARFDEAVAVLAGEGRTMVDVELGQLSDGLACVAILLRVEAAAACRDWLARHPDRIGSDVRARLRAGQLLPATAYLDALRVRRQLVRELNALFDTVDLLLLPTTPIVAPRIGATFDPIAPGGPTPRALLTSLTSLFNATGLPALSVPCGKDSAGLPVGLQIVGRRGEDGLVLAVGAAFESARGRGSTSSRPPDL
ncbi:MAG: amidase [Chloroflexota bacterium]|nr:amidase [Dehalococcoidia bacterium]MDW8254518.1 amidase [Chloroflexota bacterium]